MLTQDIVRSMFDYANGQLIWKINKSDKIKAGSFAGSINASGYVNVGIDKKLYCAHRIIFLWHYGYMPNFIDHINGITHDNRIENLRPATHSENMRNRRIAKTSSSGVTGVSWCRTKNRWESRIIIDKKNKRLGYFKTLGEAIEARREAEKIHYGKFASTIVVSLSM